MFSFVILYGMSIERTLKDLEYRGPEKIKLPRVRDKKKLDSSEQGKVELVVFEDYLLNFNYHHQEWRQKIIYFACKSFPMDPSTVRHHSQFIYFLLICYFLKRENGAMARKTVVVNTLSPMEVAMKASF